MNAGDAQLIKAGFFCDPQRCFSGARPALLQGGAIADLTLGCRVDFPRAAGGRGVIVGSRAVVLFLNTAVHKYSRIDSSALALAVSLRKIQAGGRSLPLLYSRPLADGAETAYTAHVDGVFSGMRHADGPFERSQNVWVLLHAPRHGAPPYVVMGRFRYESYIGGALCIVPQEDLVADAHILQRCLERSRAVLPPPRRVPPADDLEEQAARIEQNTPSKAPVVGAKRERE